MKYIDRALKNKLWNIIYEYMARVRTNGKFFKIIWHNFFKDRVDEIPVGYDFVNQFDLEKSVVYDPAIKYIKKKFMDEGFPFQYDFVEFFAKNINRIIDGGAEGFVNLCNIVLEEEKSPYRFSGLELVPITNEAELTEVATAQDLPDPVSVHIKKAIQLYADRTNPDYDNAVKEAISAVEAAAKMLTGQENATLGKAINKLKNQGNMHQTLAEAISKLFGWASDTVRHGRKPNQSENSEIGEKEARLALVTCSAIANYLMSSKAN